MSSQVDLYPSWLEPSSGSGTHETVLSGASHCLVRWICIQHGWNPLLGGSGTHENSSPGASQSLSRVDLYPTWLKPSAGSGTHETVLSGAS